MDIPEFQSVDTLRKLWWLHDSFWHAALVKELGFERANRINAEVAEKIGRMIMNQLLREGVIERPRSIQDLLAIFRVFWKNAFFDDLYINDPVTFDGMAKNASEILLRHPEYLRDPQLFVEAMNVTHWIKGWRDRRRSVKKPGVIQDFPYLAAQIGHIAAVDSHADKGFARLFHCTGNLGGLPGTFNSIKGVDQENGIIRECP